MHAVLYRHTAAAINMATFLGVFVDCCLFACCSGSRWGNMEQVVTQYRHPVASGVALDSRIGRCHLYCSSTPPGPSKRLADEVHSFVIVEFVINNNRS
jgi:hypothetical protein